MALAISMARRLGAKALSAPSAGNVAGTLAVYGAAARLPVTVAMPEDRPLGGFLCWRAGRETQGTAIAVPEARIEPARRSLTSASGWPVTRLPRFCTLRSS
jgi:hypothetical protein